MCSPKGTRSLKSPSSFILFLFILSFQMLHVGLDKHIEKLEAPSSVMLFFEIYSLLRNFASNN